MLNSCTSDFQNHSVSHKAFATQRINITTQHGLFRSPEIRLCDLPQESLTHVSAYLDPPSLLSLAQVCTRLHAHVSEENTWCRAFLCQFLGIGPEAELTDKNDILLRRTERTWRTEFIVRYRLRRRWEFSRSTLVSHTPVYSHISSIHLLSSAGVGYLLSSSNHYGVVARSVPTTGRVLRGYLSASGTSTGLGIGNPNTEFVPNVTACAISSDNGAARVLWGFRNGEIAIMTATPKAIEGRAPASFMRCKVDEEHLAPVEDVIWDGAVAVSASFDGTVKVWDARKLRCMWTSVVSEGALVVDHCIKVVSSLQKGIVVGVFRSGRLSIWTNLRIVESRIDAADISETKIAYPGNSDNAQTHDILALFVDPLGNVLVAYRDQPSCYCVRSSGEVVAFGNLQSDALITSVVPCFASCSTQTSFIIIGDSLGCVGIFSWDDVAAAAPARSFEAFVDGAAVTALTWNGVVLVAGSARGAIRVFDALSLQNVRTFTMRSVDQDVVSQIVLAPDRDMFVASIGTRAVCWKAGPVSKPYVARHSAHGNGKKKDRDRTRYARHVEINELIKESRDLMDVDRPVSGASPASYGRAVRSQQETMAQLGLDEGEAVEYVLMLSRDETQRQGLSPPFHSEAELFEFDEHIGNPSSFTLASARSTHSSRADIPRVTPSSTPAKVQISPRPTVEPMIAGFGDVSTEESHAPVDTLEEFPPVSLSLGASNSASSTRSGTSSTSGSGQSPTSRSPLSASLRASAWTTPIRLSPVASSSAIAVRTDNARSLGPPSSSNDNHPHSGVPAGSSDGDDAQLRLAIELSLIEARKRRDIV